MDALGDSPPGHLLRVCGGRRTSRPGCTRLAGNSLLSRSGRLCAPSGRQGKKGRLLRRDVLDFPEAEGTRHSTSNDTAMRWARLVVLRCGHLLTARSPAVADQESAEPTGECLIEELSSSKQTQQQSVLNRWTTLNSSSLRFTHRPAISFRSSCVMLGKDVSVSETSVSGKCGKTRSMLAARGNAGMDSQSNTKDVGFILYSGRILIFIICMVVVRCLDGIWLFK